MATIATLDVQFRSIGGAALAGDATAIASALLDVAKTAVNTALELNDIEQVFRKLIPSGEEAAAAIDGIRKVAEGSDFGFESLEKTAGMLLRMKVPGDQVVDTMNAIVNAVGAVEGTEENVNTVAAAIGRMNSTGEVTQRVLRQIQLAGVDAYGILRQELGLTQDEIEHISDQNLDAATVNNALLKGMFEATAVGTESMADKTAQDLKNLGDNTKKLYESLGKELLPLLKPALENINSIIKTLTISIDGLTNKLLAAYNDTATFIEKAAAFLSGDFEKLGRMNAPRAPGGASVTGHLATPTGSGSGGGLMGPPAPPGYKPPELQAIEEFDDLGQVMSDVEREYEATAKELIETAKAAEKATAALGGGTGGGSGKGGSSKSGSSNNLSEAASNTAGGMDRLRQLALEPMMNQVFKTEQAFDSLDDGIRKLSGSITISTDSVDKLFPKLEGAGDLMDQMSKQILQVTVGEGGGMLAAYHSIIAQNESSLRLLAFMEATGQGVQTAGNQFDELTNKLPNMSTAFDDLLASFQRQTAAVTENAEVQEAAAVVARESMLGGIGAAATGAAVVGEGLAQLGAGLAQYGQMAATGTLPTGLPGGNPFSQTGNPLGAGGPVHEIGPGGITNPFSTGTPWGGGVHGFPPGSGGNWGGGQVIILEVDRDMLGRVSSKGKSWTDFNNSIGTRSG